MGATQHTQIAIVTGANRGIGKATALELAHAGMVVVLACRNMASAEMARAEIVAQSHNEDVHALRLDLASRESVWQFAREFQARFPYLNILVNNAGISTMTPSFTPDGFESHIGTNFMGPGLLTLLLVPSFEPHADNRIVNVVSNIYRIGHFRSYKINRYRWFKAYAVSKYLLLLFTLGLADRLKGNDIAVNAVHPGIVKTSIMYTGKWFDFLIKAILSPFFIDVREGAATSVYVATSEEVRGVSGRYFSASKARRISRCYDRPSKRAAAWEMLRKGIDGA